MNTRPLLALACILAVTVPAFAGQGAQKAGSQSQKQKGRHVIDLSEVETKILQQLKLTPSQQRAADQARAKMRKDSLAARGAGLVPRDQRVVRSQLAKIGIEYNVAMKKILTPEQWKKYARAHANVAYALSHGRRKPKMHF
jgi:hypothetical protein